MKVTTMRKRPIAGRKLHRGQHRRTATGVSRSIRLDWLAESIQKILDLARLLPDGIERATFLLVVCGSAAKGVWGDAVATRSSHLRHCCCCVDLAIPKVVG